MPAAKVPSLDVEGLLDAAEELQRQRTEIQAQQMANRQVLRLLADNGLLNEEQQARFDRVSPKKIKGIRFNGPNGKPLAHPVYSKVYPELEGQPISQEDADALGIVLPEPEEESEEDTDDE